ncbi:hypothetical protein [Parasitella parasitica]|uniref:Uncharacterized protein n=1 Tax=Parasitella parasitica TaxID=35722 RepID=A0A0B7MXH7_9FUNG|nr:hypothetical protein [Parasitella parasitica]
MKAVYDRQIQRTIDFMRPPAKLAVARDFQAKGLISEAYLEDLINLQASTDPTAPKSSTTLFQAFRTVSSAEDIDMHDATEKPTSGSATLRHQDSSNDHQPPSLMDISAVATLTIAYTSSAGDDKPATSH